MLRDRALRFMMFRKMPAATGFYCRGIKQFAWGRNFLAKIKDIILMLCMYT